jgi:dATP pyrophosphohydrolase
MMSQGRLPYQVLILVFKRERDTYKFLLLWREDLGVWQGVAGGGEGQEEPQDAALRELEEETGLSGGVLTPLDSRSNIPVVDVAGHYAWGEKVYVIPEYCFSYEANDQDKITLSHEHIEYCWVDYTQARNMLEWDSNKTALWETKERLSKRK